MTVVDENDDQREMKCMVNLKDKVFVITGATGALGQSVAKAMYSAGCRLVLADRSVGDKFESLFPQMAGKGDRIIPVVTNLMDPDSVEKMASTASDRFGAMYGVINIAGGFRAGEPVYRTSLDTWNFMMDLNLRSVLFTCRALVPDMIKRGRGRIVNIGSRASLKGGKDIGAYSVAKAGIVRLTESLSEEVKSNGINVNCVLPGTIDTPANRADMPGADYDLWVNPEAIADVILFLVSDAARAIHGAAIPVYGTG